MLQRQRPELVQSLGQVHSLSVRPADVRKEISVSFYRLERLTNRLGAGKIAPAILGTLTTEE